MSIRLLVFDSGIGGLSVLREIRRNLPSAEIAYVADDAAFPYGDWEAGPLLEHIVALIGRLIARFQPDAVVIACNTASTLVLPALRAAHPIPFIGTVPAIKPATERTKSGVIGVLATPGTMKRDYTRELIRSFAQRCHVRLVGSSELAPLAERVMAGEDVPDEAIRTEIEPAFIEVDGRRTDVVVLACTHYPFLLERFDRLAPWPVAWVDPAEAIARRVLSVLGREPDPEGTPLNKGGAYLTSAKDWSHNLTGLLAQCGLEPRAG
ncbi:glutamate racemase [Kaistia dalseonensis]|uniref:Glutamate racemase n=1 Tax=Kaistia dalseonensis TaxID=410840 RepID=A0ABU0HBH0_9HYPH|nr:glutamate racemase [Kaistia dalseonensis]MCX5497025.1 glutamate racemase [Kaistia dalseonensis]MDQ0439651.1 glutamate racemase [Kaistia dalseonensis]